MGKLKGLVTIAEGAASASKRTSRLGRVDAAGNVIAPLNRSESPSLQPLPSIDEYQQTANKLDRADSGTTRPNDIHAELDRIDKEVAAEARAKHISSSEVDPMNAYSYQTSDAAEFAKRYRSQLVDPAYSTKAAWDGRIPDEDVLRNVETKRMKHEQMSGLIKHRVGKSNPRWRARVDEWQEGSPYDFDVFFHVDRTTDPTNLDSFVQFEKPREMGVHAGTNDAAEAMLGRGGVEAALQQQAATQGIIDEIAGLSGITQQRLERVIGRQVSLAIEQKFTRLENPSINSQEWNQILDEVEQVLGGDGSGELQSLIFSLKASPTPNTTPMIFRGKNGLLLKDDGGFGPNAVGQQLERIFPEDVDKILAAQTGGVEEANRGLQKFIESKGFDHIIYHNSVEDKGQLSIINWNPDLQRSVYDPRFAGDNPKAAASAASAAMLAVMGIGAQSADIRED